MYICTAKPVQNRISLKPANCFEDANMDAAWWKKGLQGNNALHKVLWLQIEKQFVVPSTLETDDEENTDLLLQSEGPGNELAEIVKEVKQYNHVKIFSAKICYR